MSAIEQFPIADCAFRCDFDDLRRCGIRLHQNLQSTVVVVTSAATHRQIIAVDLLDNKLDYAREFGATDLVNSSDGDAVERVVELTDGGVDYAFEAIGNIHTINQAYQMLALGGTAVVVGMAPENDEISLNALSLPRTEKTIVGSWYGGARPWVDLPKIADLYLSGKLKIDPLISRTYSLDEINIAYDALAAGEVARSIIVFE